ncbi:MAG: molybdopterin-binding protein [Chloroflexota bacterium]
MHTSELIIIGSELLLGEVYDTHTLLIARTLCNLGIELKRSSLIGDNEQLIAHAIQEAMGRAEIIITTGGLGPTVDDPTRQAVAQAFGVDNVFHPHLWEKIHTRFRLLGREPTENNKRQAFIPQGATVIENPIGTAPAFIFERENNSVICLPGVSSEMRYLLQNEIVPYLKKKYALKGVILTRVLHTAGAGESQIDDKIGELEKAEYPIVGLTAHAGQVDVHITAKADTNEAAQSLIMTTEKVIRQRLGNWIYGADEERLEHVVMRSLAARGWRLVVVESGLRGTLIQRLSGITEGFLGGEFLAHLPDLEELTKRTDTYRQTLAAEVGLGTVMYPQTNQQELHIVIHTPVRIHKHVLSFNGPPDLSTSWAVNQCLNTLREI